MKNKIANNDIKELLKNIVVEYYLESPDFNGIQIWKLLSSIEKEWVDVKPLIQDLIKTDSICIIDEKTDINPNINRIGFEPFENQIEKIDVDEPGYMCIYPTESILQRKVNPDNYKSEPYKLRLALGKAQLSYASFDLSVLEFYRNDPRYGYENSDIQGHIYYRDEQLKESDKTFLKTFGFAYDRYLNRAVAVFVRYLAHLTPEHQQIWHAKELQGEFDLHPDYYRNSILGQWGERVPICKAFATELYIINKMSEAMDRPHLFKNDYGEYGQNIPKRFHFLIRPTLEEFNSFILLLDKMISENINKKFFMNEIDNASENVRKDGKIIIEHKSTLQLLDDWIHRYFIPDDWSLWNKAITILKEIRKLRQSPAHSISNDIFDQKFFIEQRKILLNAYRSIPTIRLIFAEHPFVKNSDIKIPEWLQKGKIWTF